MLLDALYDLVNGLQLVTSVSLAFAPIYASKHGKPRFAMELEMGFVDISHEDCWRVFLL